MGPFGIFLFLLLLSWIPKNDLDSLRVIQNPDRVSDGRSMLGPCRPLAVLGSLSRACSREACFFQNKTSRQSGQSIVANLRLLPGTPCGSLSPARRNLRAEPGVPTGNYSKQSRTGQMAQRAGVFALYARCSCFVF